MKYNRIIISTLNELDHIMVIYATPFSGSTSYLHNVDKSNIRYKNGLRDGPFKIFINNGELYEEACYKKGKFHGLYKRYHLTGGRLTVKCFYNNGELEGFCKYYYVTGEIYSKQYYYKSRLHGIQQKFLRNGDLSETTVYDNGMIIRDKLQK